MTLQTSSIRERVRTDTPTSHNSQAILISYYLVKGAFHTTNLLLNYSDHFLTTYGSFQLPRPIDYQFAHHVKSVKRHDNTNNLKIGSNFISFG